MCRVELNGYVWDFVGHAVKGIGLQAVALATGGCARVVLHLFTAVYRVPFFARAHTKRQRRVSYKKLLETWFLYYCTIFYCKNLQIYEICCRHVDRSPLCRLQVHEFRVGATESLDATLYPAPACFPFSPAATDPRDELLVAQGGRAASIGSAARVWSGSVHL